jgi:hypothetical protein
MAAKNHGNMALSVEKKFGRQLGSLLQKSLPLNDFVLDGTEIK